MGKVSIFGALWKCFFILMKISTFFAYSNENDKSSCWLYSLCITFREEFVSSLWERFPWFLKKNHPWRDVEILLLKKGNNWGRGGNIFRKIPIFPEPNRWLTWDLFANLSLPSLSSIKTHTHSGKTRALYICLGIIMAAQSKFENIIFCSEIKF